MMPDHITPPKQRRPIGVTLLAWMEIFAGLGGVLLGIGFCAVTDGGSGHDLASALFTMGLVLIAVSMWPFFAGVLMLRRRKAGRVLTILFLLLSLAAGVGSFVEGEPIPGTVYSLVVLCLIAYMCRRRVRAWFSREETDERS
jgi:hypothetical protein